MPGKKKPATLLHIYTGAKIVLKMKTMFYKFRINRVSNLRNYITTVVMSLIMILPFMAISQKTITGKVFDAANNKPLAAASIAAKGSTTILLTNAEGTFSMEITKDVIVIVVSHAGYETSTTRVDGTTTDFSIGLQSSMNELQLVTVTGSRNLSRTNVQTAVPVDVIPVAKMAKELGQIDLNQLLTYAAPSFQSARQTVSDGTDHVDPAQLRGLGSDQILVLINGKRRHQSALVNVNGTVNRGQVGTDLSTIPVSAIERVEILRDGAAAQYGSDAIAGVINIVLKKKTGVLEGTVSYGEYVTGYDKNFALFKTNNKTNDPSVKINDGGSFQASLGYGFNIGKGFLNLTGEYINREGTNRTGTYTGAVYPNVNGINKDDSILSARSLTRENFDMRIGNSELKAGNVFYNFNYPVGRNGELYAFGGYGNKKGNATGIFRYPSGYANVGNAEKFAPQALLLYPDGFLPQILSDITDFSTAVGFRTKFNQCNFDISNTYGINKFDFGVENSVNYSQFALPSAGNTQTSFDPGGLKFWQNIVNADLSKHMNVLAGLNIAGGLEYRIDAFGLRSGEEASYKNFDAAPSKVAPGAQVFPGFVNTLGGDKKRNSAAAYIDLEQDFTKHLLIEGALRFEHYSDFGSTLNYKLAGRYKFSDAFALRGSVNSGFRAPSMQQRFYTKTNTIFVGNPLAPVQAATLTNDSRAAELLGIPKLKEETSQNYSVGMTAKPFAGFEITVDAYQVNVKNRIILTNNFNGNSNAQIKTILDAEGASQANFFTNAVDTRARGLEAVMSYNKSFNRKQSLRTSLAMTFIDNEIKKDANGKPVIHASDILINGGQLGNYFNREDQSRFEVANPKNKITLTFNYKYNKFGAMLRFVEFGKVTYLDPTINPDSTQKFPVNAFTGKKETLDQTFSAKTVTDLSLSYDLDKYLQLPRAPIIFSTCTRISTHIAATCHPAGLFSAGG
jgi:iron complex outermembrane receptor protein